MPSVEQRLNDIEVRLMAMEDAQRVIQNTRRKELLDQRITYHLQFAILAALQRRWGSVLDDVFQELDRARDQARAYDNLADSEALDALVNYLHQPSDLPAND